jgi:hypothetical protein
LTAEVFNRRNRGYLPGFAKTGFAMLQFQTVTHRFFFGFFFYFPCLLAEGTG